MVTLLEILLAATPPSLLITSTAMYKVPWALYQKSINTVSHWLATWQTAAKETKRQSKKSNIKSTYISK